MARAAGNQNVGLVLTLHELEKAIASMRSGILVAMVEPGSANSPLIEMPEKEILKRFMRAARPSK